MTNKKQEFDDLDLYIAERAKKDPEFPQLVEASLERRRLLRQLAASREKLGLSQTMVAARMRTSQSAVARIESAEIDTKFSTVEKYAAAVGQKIVWRLVKASGGS